MLTKSNVTIRTDQVARLRQCFLDEWTHVDAMLLLDRYDFIAIAEKAAALKDAAYASGKLTNSAQSHLCFYRDVLAGRYGSKI